MTECVGNCPMRFYMMSSTFSPYLYPMKSLAIVRFKSSGIVST